MVLVYHLEESHFCLSPTQLTEARKQLSRDKLGSMETFLSLTRTVTLGEGNWWPNASSTEDQDAFRWGGGGRVCDSRQLTIPSHLTHCTSEKKHTDENGKEKLGGLGPSLSARTMASSNPWHLNWQSATRKEKSLLSL